MRVHLVDGTYELFRAFYGAPAAQAPDGREVGATRALLRSLLALARAPGVTHLACAFDHVVESFRNRLYAGYKTGEGLPAEILGQFELAERASRALGFVTWPMVEFEADDALASAAARWASADGVEQVVICSPDKDLAQCVRGTRVVCLDRRRGLLLDEAAVLAKFGVPPAAMVDWLALVGDASDGYPGLRGWGPKSAAALLSRYGSIDAIPAEAGAWQASVRAAAGLAESLRAGRAELELYRELARLRLDVPLVEELDELRWRGARRDELRALCRQIDDLEFLERVAHWRE